MAGQPPHHREMVTLRRDKERGDPVDGWLGDRPAVAGQPLHHRKMALLDAAIKSGVIPALAGWVTDPPLPASHCTTARWPAHAAT